MAVRVQVNVSEQMVELVDRYAEMMGISRSALCSVFITNGATEYKTRLGLPQEGTSNVGGNTNLLTRFKMVFDGWAAQFENIPTGRPEITLNDGFVCIGGQKICSMQAKVTSTGYDDEWIQIVWEKDDVEYKSIIQLSWSDESNYHVNKVDVYKEPHFEPIDLSTL